MGNSVIDGVVNTAKDLTPKMIDVVPGFGTAYHFLGYQWDAVTGDYKGAIIHMVDALEGAIRDMAFGVFGPWACVVHTEVETFTDYAIGEIVKALPERDKIKKYLNSLTEEQRKNGQLVLVHNNYHEKFKEKFTEMVTLSLMRGAICAGVFNYGDYASDEAIFIHFPSGLGNGHLVNVTWRWTKDGTGREKVPVALHYEITNWRYGKGDEYYFALENASNYYTFAGSFYAESGRVALSIFSKDKTRETYSLPLVKFRTLVKGKDYAQNIASIRAEVMLPTSVAG